MLLHKRSRPLINYVLVDTEVIAQVPPRLLVAGMGDALATWFEARTCVAGHVKNMRGGGSTNSAAALAELCYKTLLEDGAAALRAVETKVVTPASSDWSRRTPCFPAWALNPPAWRRPTPCTMG